MAIGVSVKAETRTRRGVSPLAKRKLLGPKSRSLSWRTPQEELWNWGG